MNTTKETLYVLAAGVLWGLVSMFVRALAAAGLEIVEITFYVLLRARLTCFSTPFSPTARYSHPAARHPLFHERIVASKVTALVLAVVGCALVVGFTGSAMQVSFVALALGLLSGLSGACYSLCGRVAMRHCHKSTIIFYSFAFALLPFLLVGDIPHIARLAHAQPIVLAWGAGIGLACTLGPYVLYAIGLDHMEASRASIMASVDPAVGSLLVIFAYGESANPTRLLGVALTLAAVMLLNSEGGEKGVASDTPEDGNSVEVA